MHPPVVCLPFGHCVAPAMVVDAAAQSQLSLKQAVEPERRGPRDFMVTFRRALQTAGRVAAFQWVQRNLLGNPQTAHPFYRAPFILIGAR